MTTWRGIRTQSPICPARCAQFRKLSVMDVSRDSVADLRQRRLTDVNAVDAGSRGLRGGGGAGPMGGGGRSQEILLGITRKLNELSKLLMHWPGHPPVAGTPPSATMSSPKWLRADR
jgi:hypothetical protein